VTLLNSKKIAPSLSDNNPKYLELIAALFSGLLIVSNVCSNRLISVGPLEFDAGTLMFPLTYIFGDLLTEVYGYARSRRVIWAGFASMFLAVLCLYVASIFPSPVSWREQGEAWNLALGLTPRIALASLLAYLVGEFANSITLAKMKLSKVAGSLAFRFIVSTLVGQFFDTIIFASIAFLGVLDFNLWITLVVSNFVYKVALEIILLPLSLIVVKRLIAAENLSPETKEPSFNPFRWKVERP
jgi:uncharacterized integral membrane protein (TIGR00697 family)